MAKTKSSVTMAYKKAVKEAENLEDIARKMEGQKNKLGSKKAELSGVWKGNNSNLYQRKMSDRENELASIISDIREIARVIKEVARSTYNADMRAVELAKKRQYKASGGGGKGAFGSGGGGGFR